MQDDNIDYYSPFYDNIDLNDNTDNIDNINNIDNELFESDDNDAFDYIGAYMVDTSPYNVNARSKYTGWNNGQLGRYYVSIKRGHKNTLLRYINNIVYIRTETSQYTIVVNNTNDLDQLLKEAPLKYSDAIKIYHDILDIINQDV